jgi:WD40 repeat protein
LDLAFIGRGEEVLSASKDGTVKQWNCGLGKSVSTLNLPNGFPTCMKLNDERSLLVVGSDRGYLYIFDANSKNVVGLKFHFRS